MTQQQIIKQNSDLLISLYKLDLPLSQKMTIIEQLKSNLKYLKQELDKEEYESRFSKVESNLNKIITDLTSSDFIKELIVKLKAISGV